MKHGGLEGDDGVFGSACRIPGGSSCRAGFMQTLSSGFKSASVKMSFGKTQSV